MRRWGEGGISPGGSSARDETISTVLAESGGCRGFVSGVISLGYLFRLFWSATADAALGLPSGR